MTNKIIKHNDFELDPSNTINDGEYGAVYQVKEKKTGKYYPLKVFFESNPFLDNYFMNEILILS